MTKNTTYNGLITMGILIVKRNLKVDRTLNNYKAVNEQTINKRQLVCAVEHSKNIIHIILNQYQI